MVGTLVCIVFTLNVTFTPIIYEMEEKEKKMFCGKLEAHSIIYFCLSDFIPTPLACFIFEREYKVPFRVAESVDDIRTVYIPKCKCMVCNWCDALFVLKVPVLLI